MADSLRDQLLKSGIAKQFHAERAASPQRRPGRPRDTQRESSPAPKARRDAVEMDLAKAYALRAQDEARARHRAEQAAAEAARQKRERKQKIQQLLAGKALNQPAAELARNFEYGGKIRRLYVDAGQLAALNAGELGIVQQGGRYLLVTRAIAEQVAAIEPALLALLVDPDARDEGDEGVPDDLRW